MASVFAIIRNADAKLLFVQRTASSSRPLQWTLPGGKRKSREDPEQAVVREVREETGLDVSVARQLADFGDQSYWLCELVSSSVVTLRERECSAFAWCDSSELRNLGFIMDFSRVVVVLREMGISLGSTERQ